ncbi:MAG: hypothetical protein MUC85_07920 [Anaerolineales bacterium]|jgi:hypothetical protein|nr:hypothetical protein [Anaerolineales bacterium]
MKETLSANFQSVYTTTLQGITLQTGDIICTTDGNTEILPGEFWRFIGRLLPGEVDHIVMYIGPGGRCVEAGGLGVITFEFEDGTWDGSRLLSQRGMLVDTLYGVAYPLRGRGYTQDEETNIRLAVASFCLAQVGKPYNLNFLNPDTEDSFYCSQLAYKAYLPHQINLNTGRMMPKLPATEAIIFPQEIWDVCEHEGV